MASAAVDPPPDPFPELSSFTFSSSDDDEPPLTDFEFRPDDPAAMLSADELISDGKLVPLHLRHGTGAGEPAASGARESRPFSPKAPRCSARWKELLLKKAALLNSTPDAGGKADLPAQSRSPKMRSLKHFLLRNPKPSPLDPSMSAPLLRAVDPQSAPDHGDLPRLSLDCDKRNPARVRISKASRSLHVGIGAGVESPRVKPCGRVVFQGLERSASSPGSFGCGATRVEHRGVARSYSANVRVAPVLNVFGFAGMLSTTPRKEVAGRRVGKRV